MQQELAFFCRAFLSGVILTVSYDILRIFRNVKVHNVVLTGIEDFLYWCMAGIFLFSMIYGENDGVIQRLYIMLCRAWSIGILQRNQQSYGEGKYLGVKETWEAFGITSKTHKKMEKKVEISTG